MPLTNVWSQDIHGEWVRTTAEKAEKNFRYSVSADSHMFRCYSCFQYVTFVKGSSSRVSHFRHSSSETNKDCEDRSTIYSYDSTLRNWQTNTPDPLRLIVDGKRIGLEIGFLPADRDELEKAIKMHAVISIKGKTNRPDVYMVDYSRFIPHAMTWLPIPFSAATEFSVSMSPSGSCPNSWGMKRNALTREGNVFDCATGRRIIEKSDAEVGHYYYFLCSRWTRIPKSDAVHIEKLEISDEQWNLYRFAAMKFSNAASDIFFDYFHLRLTSLPADIQVIWPPVLENEDIIATNADDLTMLMSGESDFETYPRYGYFVTTEKKIDEHTRIISLENTGKLQMVSASRYSQKLRCFYIHPLEIQGETVQPDIQICDAADAPVNTNVLSKLPKNRTLKVCSEVDGVIEVSDKDGFSYRKPLTAGQEVRLIDLTYGMVLTVRQGMDIIAQISISHQRKELPNSSMKLNWKGPMVPFPRRYAGVLSLFSSTEEVYSRVHKALEAGRIPAEAFKGLRKAMEEHERGR